MRNATLLCGLLACCVALRTELRIPGILPQAETYTCTSFQVGDVEQYITGFNVSENGNVHHILLFGCEEPGSNEPVWDCGDMNEASWDMIRAPTCKTKPTILYAWAKKAPALQLPPDVAFKTGGLTNIKHLVMQVHYMNDGDEPDESGIIVTHSDEPARKTAATMLLVTGGVLPAHSTEVFETACVIEEDVTIHPFAFRTHTHKHGTDVSGWIVQEDNTGNDKWTLIGRRDPQLPQMFVPVANSSIEVQKGDMLAARCVMKNDEDRDIEMGASGKDEMCNFYLMYWADSDNILKDNTCFSPGAPEYRWESEAALNHIPK